MPNQVLKLVIFAYAEGAERCCFNLKRFCSSRKSLMSIIQLLQQSYKTLATGVSNLQPRHYMLESVYISWTFLFFRKKMQMLAKFFFFLFLKICNFYTFFEVIYNWEVTCKLKSLAFIVKKCVLLIRLLAFNAMSSPLLSLNFADFTKKVLTSENFTKDFRTKYDGNIELIWRL